MCIRDSLYVVKACQSLTSRGFLKTQFSWQWYYYTLTPEGLDYLREWLHLPAEIVPQTHVKQQRSHAPPRGMMGGEGGDRERRGGGRGGPRGDREGGREGGYVTDTTLEYMHHLLTVCLATAAWVTARRRVVWEARVPSARPSVTARVASVMVAVAVSVVAVVAHLQLRMLQMRLPGARTLSRTRRSSVIGLRSSSAPCHRLPDVSEDTLRSCEGVAQHGYRRCVS